MANYSDDFSSYPVATGVPSGFTARWVTTNVTHSIVSGGADRFFRQTRSVTGRGLVTFDAVDGDSNRANSEILVRVKVNNPAATQASAGPALRCSGTAGAETGYVCYPVGNKLRVTWYKGGVSNTDHRESSTLTLTDGAWYWIRFRVENTTTPIALKAKIWAGEIGDEPGTWNVETTETNIGGTSITAAGWSGMFSFTAISSDTDDIAVGTNGDTASMSGGGITGSGANTIGAFTQVAAGTVSGAGAITGSGANTLGAFTQVADGTVTGAGSISGSGANTLGAFTQTATGTVTSPSLTVGPFKNKSGAVLANLSVPHVVVMRRSDRVAVLSIAGQTTNGAGMLVISDAALVAGTEYMVSSWSNDGLNAGNARFTAA
jgi:hypothetical protein